MMLRTGGMYCMYIAVNIEYLSLMFVFVYM